MQIYEASLGKEKRPCSGKECPVCQGCQKFHCHGVYRRLRGAEGNELVEVRRYLCRRCGHTWSVIPEGMMPYRSVPVKRFEAVLDEHFGMVGGGARPPPTTEIEEGCVRRAIRKLSERVTFLSGLLGQQMPLLGSVDIGGFWRAMRELGSTQQILIALAENFKTSLLGCYRSLRAHWEREKISGAVF